jgi:hypothetical protein
MNDITLPPVIFLTSSIFSRFVCSNVGLLWARCAAVDGAARAAAPELPSVLDLNVSRSGGRSSLFLDGLQLRLRRLLSRRLNRDSLAYNHRPVLHYPGHVSPGPVCCLGSVSDLLLYCLDSSLLYQSVSSKFRLL